MANREDRSLSAPILMVDGRRIKVIPKSVSNEIPGAAKVRAVSSGTSISLVHGIDLEEMKCQIVFKVANTAEMVEFAKDMAQRRNTGALSTISLIEDEDQANYDQCMLVNKLKIPREPEGEIEFEWEGRYTEVA